MKTMAIILAGVLCLSAHSRIPRPGGDGPVPVQNSTHELISAMIAHPVDSSVQEFVSKQRNHTIFFKNKRGHLFRTDLIGEHSEWIGTTKYPLSRSLDANQPYLLAENRPLIFELARQKWHRIPNLPSDVTHLFWNESKLFSLARKNQSIQVWAYTPDQEKTELTCQLRFLQRFHLANGHHYPNVYLYRLEQKAKLKRLLIYKWDVKSCDFRKDMSSVFELEEKFLGPELLEGQIKQVARFPKIGAMAVSIDHPTHRFLWKQSGKALFLDVIPGEVYIPRFDLPVFAVANPQDGLWLYLINERKKVKLLPSLGIGKQLKNSVWLSPMSNTVIVNPTLQKNGRGHLFEFSLR